MQRNHLFETSRTWDVVYTYYSYHASVNMADYESKILSLFFFFKYFGMKKILLKMFDIHSVGG